MRQHVTEKLTEEVPADAPRRTVRQELPRPLPWDEAALRPGRLRQDTSRRPAILLGLRRSVLGPRVEEKTQPVAELTSHSTSGCIW